MQQLAFQLFLYLPLTESTKDETSCAINKWKNIRKRCGGVPASMPPGRAGQEFKLSYSTWWYVQQNRTYVRTSCVHIYRHKWGTYAVKLRVRVSQQRRQQRHGQRRHIPRGGPAHLVVTRRDANVSGCTQGGRPVYLATPKPGLHRDFPSVHVAFC